MKLIDITGQVFGLLTVIRQGPVRESKVGGSIWICKCECGKAFNAVGSRLRKGVTKSCGCLVSAWGSSMGSNPQFIKKRAEKITKHGQKRKGNASAEYKTWLGMKSRCNTPSNKDYEQWGGRGIRVCDEWQSDFSQFFKDMGPKPTPQHTIDRENSNGNYEPRNCRWATTQQQGAENRRGFVSVTVNGIQFNKIADACRHFGVSPTTANERIKAGIPLDLAFSPERLKSRRTKESYLRKSTR